MECSECSICLEPIKPHTKYKLSCDHTIHYSCFLDCVYHNDFNIFINCPLCREVNFYNKTIRDTDLDNIKEINIIKRCNHKTREGKRCKNKSHILNYGACYIHKKDVLPKDKYELMCNYIYWLFETGNKTLTKIYMIDIGKKLVMKHKEITTIQEIQHYFFRFYKVEKNNGTCFSKGLRQDFRRIYNFYDLEVPPNDWIQECCDNRRLL